jgi:hypothetical protein
MPSYCKKINKYLQDWEFLSMYLVDCVSRLIAKYLKCIQMNMTRLTL